MMLRVLASAIVLGILGVLWSLWTAAAPVDGWSEHDDARHFALKVLPLLQAKCAACHGADPKNIEGGLDLTSAQGIASRGETGDPIVVAGDPSKGLLMEAVRREGLEMPPKEQDRLTVAEIKVFEQWIAAGARWPDAHLQASIQQESLKKVEDDRGVLVRTSGGLAADWTNRRYNPEDLWAYQPIKKSTIDTSTRNPIDVLIERKLELSGFEPAASADPLTLIRRVTFDVTGLPPTLSQLHEFLDEWELDPDVAWRSLVDRLLASPHYGEQAARHWLDVVRYADSSGFANDWQRPNAWRYRDYVIRAFNDDKPYDRFVKEQIAGDELSAHDPEMKIAVGFLRMGPWEHTTMSVPTVSRQQFLDDVTDAVGQVFLAHPLQCARCHDHKFDPIPTRDYYALQAAFACTQLADVDAAWLPEENLYAIEEDQQAHRKKQAWNKEIHDQLQQRIREEEKAWFRERGLPYESRDEAKRAGAAPEEIPEHRVGLTPDELGLNNIGSKWQVRFDWEATRYQPIALSVYNGATNLPKGVSKPLPVPADPTKGGDVEQTFILTGGDPFAPGESVSPGVLSVLNDGQPMKITQQVSGRRLALAEWLVEPSNPLTARVIINRVWQSHFGRGLVETANNFGAMGKKPTHPELLDYLAATFVEQGWSIKKLRRLILTSAAYRRSSTYQDPAKLDEIDPARTLYAVFSPRRLVAEELRDAMLAVSGELNPELGGLPARPDMNLEAALQPRLIMGTFAPAYVPNANPAQRNRRSIYALKLRGLRDPFMEVYNQPSPDIACEVRDQSNVTPQVFALLNSEESADRALALAKRVVDASASDGEAVEQLYWLVYGRAPLSEEADSAIDYWHEVSQRQSEIEYHPREYPTQVVRQANEEMSGQVFEFVERLFEYESYQPDLQPHEVDARTRGFADVCLMMLNSNEFVYVY